MCVFYRWEIFHLEGSVRLTGQTLHVVRWPWQPTSCKAKCQSGRYSKGTSLRIFLVFR